MKLKWLMVVILLSTFAVVTTPCLAQDLKPDSTVTVMSYGQIESADGQHEAIFDSQLSIRAEALFKEAGWSVFNAPTTPLVSHDQLQYTLVENADLKGKDDKTGHLFVEVGSGGSVKIESETGVSAFSTLEIHSIFWDIDQEKALKSLEKSPCRYALLISASAEDQTRNLTKPGNTSAKSVSGQRSIRAKLSMRLMNVKTSEVVKSFSDEIPAMSSTTKHAAEKGWDSLLVKAFDSWFKLKSKSK